MGRWRGPQGDGEPMPGPAGVGRGAQAEVATRAAHGRLHEECRPAYCSPDPGLGLRVWREHSVLRCGQLPGRALCVRCGRSAPFWNTTPSCPRASCRRGLPPCCALFFAAVGSAPLRHTARGHPGAVARRRACATRAHAVGRGPRLRWRCCESGSEHLSAPQCRSEAQVHTLPRYCSRVAVVRAYMSWLWARLDGARTPRPKVVRRGTAPAPCRHGRPKSRHGSPTLCGRPPAPVGGALDFSRSPHLSCPLLRIPPRMIWSSGLLLKGCAQGQCLCEQSLAVS